MQPSQAALGEKILTSVKPGEMMVKIVHDELIKTLGKPGSLDLSGNTPHIIMLIGLFEIGQLARSNKVTSPPASGG